MKRRTSLAVLHTAPVNMKTPEWEVQKKTTDVYVGGWGRVEDVKER